MECDKGYYDKILQFFFTKMLFIRNGFQILISNLFWLRIHVESKINFDVSTFKIKKN